jgi:methyl-accepting chemotaxis protein
MIHSLRFKLLLVTVLVSGLAVAAVAFFSSRATRLELKRFVESTDASNLERMRNLLTEYYQKNHGWEGIASSLEQVSRPGDRRIIIVDTNGKLIATWPEDGSNLEIEIKPDNGVIIRRTVSRPAASGSPPTESGGRRVEVVDQVEMVLMNPLQAAINNSEGIKLATLYLLPLEPPAETSDEKVFVESFDRSLIIAVLVVVVIALVATVLLSRPILGPVELLTQAARQMERGDLNQRVEVKSQDEIGQLSRAFNAMADSLSRVERLRRDMVSDVAHELRTPLTNIRCQIEALQDGLAKPSPAVLESLHEEVLILNRLIEDLQELSLAEAGQLRFTRESVSIHEVLSRSVNASSAQAASKQITISIDAPADMPPAYADMERVSQILRNLLANAVTHTPTGGLIEV